MPILISITQQRFCTVYTKGIRSLTLSLVCVPHVLLQLNVFNGVRSNLGVRARQLLPFEKVRKQAKLISELLA
jgi:hypothetical protein